MTKNSKQQTVVSRQGINPPPSPPFNKGGKGGFSPVSCLLDKRGFALVSMIIILALMGIAAGVATSFAHRLKTSRKQLATEEKLKALKESIMGNPRQYSIQGRSNFGYLGDMGGLPGTLADLYTKGTQPDYTPGTAGQGAGWAGPYITPLLREDLSDLLKDAFNNVYAYTTTAYQRASDNEWVSARIRSFGANKTDDNGTGDDKQVEILRRETLSTVSGYVTDSTGTGINNATVTLYYPYGGSVNNVNTTTDATGLFQFTNVPYGVRTILATASPTGTIQYAESSALAVGGNNLSFNVTNLGATAVTINSIKLEYNVTGKAYYEQVYVGNATTVGGVGPPVFDYLRDNGGNRGNGNSPTPDPPITFSNTSISSGSSASSTTRILVATDIVQLPSIVLYPKGGSTLNIRYLNFMKKKSGASGSVSIDWASFTATLYYNASPVLTASFTARIQP